MPVYDSLLDALADLKQKGYTTDFNLAFDNIHCRDTGTSLLPEQFEIVDHFRFEANTDPDESSVLYVIESLDGKTRGTLISAYGAYSDEMHEDMIRKLKVHG